LSTATDVVALGRRTLKQFLADDALGLAAQVAYSAILAFFPTMIFLVGLLDLVNAYDALRGFLEPVAPEAVLKLIAEVGESASGAGSVLALLLGGAGALWAASGAMSAVIKAVNRAYGCAETRPFWKLRLVAVVLVLLTAAAAFAILVLIVFGAPLGRAIAAKAGLGGAFDTAWGIARWPIALAAIVLFFSLVYAIAPGERVRHPRWISAGALVGALLWLGLSGLFALYTSFADSFNETYGSIAGGIVLLLWLNYSALALLLGAELDAELRRRPGTSP
jgi:membrane protein